MIDESLLDAPPSAFGQIALREGLVQKEQLFSALRIQEKLSSLGVVPKKLGEILVEKGVLNAAQVDTILSIQRKMEKRTEIGGYEILELLGKGGMGAVYRARQKSLDRIVALKILAPRYARDQSFIKRFINEARTVAKLNHENIIAGIDVGESSGCYFFAMEYVEGPTVHERIEQKGRIPDREALEIIMQMCHALEHAHSNGLVHRDVKPQNIILTLEGVAKLCDLGLAKLENEPTDSSTTSVGTPHYVSPEQARGEQDIDIRSDIYSLGATLYHMVTGETPFVARNGMILMTKHLTEDPVFAQKRHRAVGRSVSELIRKMMDKDRAGRYQTPTELREAVEKIMTRKPGTSARRRAASQRVSSPEKRRRTRYKPRKQGHEVITLAIVALLVVIIIGSAAYSFLSEPLVQPPPTYTPDEIAEGFNELKQADLYAQQHPGDIAAIIGRYQAIIEKYPSSKPSAHAERMITEIRQRSQPQAPD